MWIAQQRKKYKENKLFQKHIEKLNSIGFEFEGLTSWEDRFALAKAFFDEHGDLDISSNYMVNGFKLRQWLMRQKRYAEKGGSTKIKPEQIEKLCSIGLFDELTGTEKIWLKHYEQAKKYYAEHGDLHIPNDYIDDGFQLGIWLAIQKQKKRKGELEKDKIDLLDELNNEWENMSEKANAQLYENGFQRLEQFIAE